MTFIWPVMLLLLVLVPLLVLLYFRLQQRRKQLAAAYGSLGFVQSTAGSKPGIRRHIPPLLFLISIIILIIATARPQTLVHLPTREGTVILVFDVSGSMAADDMQPTRMEAAKAAARAFVERQPSSMQIGIVAFSDGGFSIQAPTNEQEAILTTINRLAPQRGTSLGQGILASLNTIAADKGEIPVLGANRPDEPTPTPTPMPEGAYTNAVIVLLTDGENNASPDPLEAAQLAADRGVRIHTVGIGSAAGTTIEVEGFTVHTSLDEALLQQISHMTGGTYFNAKNEEDLRAIYENIEPQFVIKPEMTEVTSLFAGASIFILLIGGIFSMLWFSRVP